MGSVEVTKKLPVAGNWSKLQSEWFETITDELARQKALTGLAGLRVVVRYQSLYLSALVRGKMLIQATELQPANPRAALQRFALDFSQGGALSFADCSYAPECVGVEMDFKDPNKAMLFKLAWPR